MRVAFLVVSILLVATPSQASSSCMSMREARSHFATSYLYWHGPNHCWDATSPVRRHEAQRARHVVFRPASEEANALKWRDAMSEMLGDESTVLSADRRQAQSERNDSANWLDRWVDIAQIRGRLVTETKPGLVGMPPAVDSPMITHRIVALVCFGLLIIVSIFELVRRRHGERDRAV